MTVAYPRQESRDTNRKPAAPMHSSAACVHALSCLAIGESSDLCVMALDPEQGAAAIPIIVVSLRCLEPAVYGGNPVQVTRVLGLSIGVIPPRTFFFNSAAAEVQSLPYRCRDLSAPRSPSPKAREFVRICLACTVTALVGAWLRSSFLSLCLRLCIVFIDRPSYSLSLLGKQVFVKKSEQASTGCDLLDRVDAVHTSFI